MQTDNSNELPIYYWVEEGLFPKPITLESSRENLQPNFICSNFIFYGVIKRLK